ncbi:FeoB-associated Cys-rich membrane protein [Planctopirus limnophila]|uniref:FeoB-associated Cys-rich membrane protein n=1 Tax=Planctopirus limnophila TaxID=120 RepID=UPI0011D0F854
MWETFIVVAIVVVAATQLAWLSYRSLASRHGKKSGGCGSCRGCSHANPSSSGSNSAAELPLLSNFGCGNSHTPSRRFHQAENPPVFVKLSPVTPDHQH